MGKWDYVGGREVEKREEMRRITKPERNENEGNGYTDEYQRGNKERARVVTRVGNQNTQAGRRYSERETERERNTRDRYPRKNRTEAIVVHKAEQVESYADILRKVKGNNNIEELGIRETRIRRTVTGSLLIQIAGEESKKKADVLAERMREMVGQEAKVGRPSRKAEIKISGLDEDTTVEDVAAIAKYGDCDSTEIKAGGIRRNRQGEGDI